MEDFSEVCYPIPENVMTKVPSHSIIIEAGKETQYPPPSCLRRDIRSGTPTAELGQPSHRRDHVDKKTIAYPCQPRT
jgi:hypothetical protein